MRTKFISLILVLFIAGAINRAEARLLPNTTVFQLQFQKSLFVSGEKIWFKTSIASGHDNNHQTILYADLCGEGTLVNSCILKRENNHWEGDMLIPDSLETGIYLFRVYTGNYDGSPEMVSKLITVINRFGNNKSNETRKQNSGYQPLDLLHDTPQNAGSALNLTGGSSQLKPGDFIDLKIEKNNISFSSGVSLSVYKVPVDGNVPAIETYPETKVINSTIEQPKIFNKLTLCGKVIDKLTKEPVVGETVLFSVPDSIPQINYAVTDETGEFLFEVDDYYGVQDLILQTLAKKREYDIILYPNFLNPPLKIPFYIASDLENGEFAKLSVIQSMLNNAYGQSDEQLSVKSLFKYPFYGSTNNVVIPDRYIDLNDFEEISKELLPICHIKKEKKEAFLTIYDSENLRLFESPWIIIDGVPVFNIKLLFPFNSQMIKRIEIQPQTRCFGGLFIDGTLSVFTKDGKYSGVPLPSNAIRKAFETFHIPQKYSNWHGNKEKMFPDFRDVLFWEPVVSPLSNTLNTKVQTSFEKGAYVAVAQAMDEDGVIYRSVFNFTVN